MYNTNRWTTVLVLAVVLLFGVTSAFSAAVTPTPGSIRANFGVDADLYKNMAQFSVDGFGNPATSDDWYLPAGVAGRGVIDTTGMAAMRAIYQSPDLATRNRTFVARQWGGSNTTVDGRFWLDAVYVRDNFTSGNQNDSSVFSSTSSKNGDNTKQWTFGIGGAPNKNDLIDAAAHLRREGTASTDPLWLFALTTTLSADGNAHNDYEFFRTIPSIVNGRLTNAGPDSGHTAWKVVSSVLVPGDIVVSVDFENGGSTPAASVRLWLQEGTQAAISAASGGVITFTGVAEFGGTAVGTAPNRFGYAEVTLPAATFFARVNKTDANNAKGTATKAAPFGHFEESQATFADSIQGLALAEIGINLSALGLDIQSQQGPCVDIFGSILFKTRSSSSFTAELKDEIGPFPFGRREEVNILTTGGQITCASPTVQLMASATPSAVTYSWSGPGGFTSAAQNPTVGTSGTYIVTATLSSGCFNTASAVVTQNTTAPGASATGGQITCSNPTVQLQGATTSGTSYAWSGPGGFTSAAQNPTVGTSGTYTLITTNSVNGCTSSAQANVSQNTTPPGASATGGQITCSNPTVQLQGATTSGTSYAWSGPGGFTSAVQNPTVGTSGTYTLITTNSVNGCTSSAQAIVSQNTTPPGASATGGQITCANPTVQLQGATSTGTSYAWSGPGGFTSALQNPTVGTSGTYTLLVTNSVNGCTSTTQTTVTQNTTPPGASATGGQITCANPTVQLQGATTSGTSYAWSGPGGFTSAAQNPTVGTSGTYVLLVTNSVNGCTSTAQALVTQNTDFPGASATGGQITCANPTVQLQGATTSGTSYAWSGPGGFTSAAQNPTVGTSGTYILLVTNSVNGCTSTAQAVVSQNTTPPGASATGGQITCSNPTVQLQGATTSGTSYAWSGPGGFTSAAQNPTVGTSGTYTLLVTNSVNGCTSTTQTTVTQNTTPPGASATGGQITCANPTVQLQGASTSGTSYAWSGPGGFTSAAQNPTVGTSGTYVLLVTNSVNGCTSTTQTTVTQNTTPPGASATGGQITCANPTVQLQGATTSGTSYAWSGPGGFTSAAQNPTVGTSGTYVLLVTNSVNGCTSTAQAVVTQSTDFPGASATGGQITCANPTVQLQGATTSGTSYAWSGPGGFTSALQNPTVGTSGTYILLVTNSANGCTSTAQAVVSQNTTPPGASATGGQITCANPTVQLQGSSTSGTSYAWSGPGGFTSAAQNPTVGTSGTYTLLVTNSVNGCTSTTQTTVTQNTTPPGASATGGQITCANPTVQLQGATTSGTSYAWSGPGGFTSAAQNPTVGTSGTYVLLVTNSVNGCTSTAQAVVTQSTAMPGASATGGQITCANPTVQLQGATTSGTSYAWSGPGGFTSAAQNPTVGTSGTYILLVTNSVNGCTSTAQAVVTQNTTAPGASATGGQITCANPTVQLQGASTSGTSYAWSGPGGFTSAAQNPTVGTSGTYVLLVTNSVNGCTSTAQAVVTQNTTPPGASVVGGQITCTNPTVQLQGGPGGFQYLWSGPGGFTSAAQNPTVGTSGTYVLQVTNTVNGCTSTAQGTVTQSTTPPGASATGGTITCANPCVNLAGATTSGTSYSWSGPGGFTSAAQNPTVCTTGTYILMTTNSVNGCTSTAQAVVNANLTPPSCSLTAPSTLPPCGSTGNTLTASSSNAGGYVWSVSGAGWSITGGQGTNSITYSAGNVGSQGIFKLVVTNTANGCKDSCEVQFTCASQEEFCGVTQGFWGNAGGKFCSAGSPGTLALLQSIVPVGNPLYIGKPGHSLTITNDRVDCIIKRLPGGGPSKQLNAGDYAFDASCNADVTTIKNGRFHNNLLAQTITLALNIRLGNGELASLYIAGPVMMTTGANFVNGVCADGDDTPSGSGGATHYISPSVLTALGIIYGDSTVAHLVDLANRALAYGTDSTAGASLTAIQGACDAFNNAFDKCRFLVGFSTPTTAELAELAKRYESGSEYIPTDFELEVNYPNPFNPSTAIEYGLPEASTVRLSVYNILGQEVATLVDGYMDAGYQSVIWNARNTNGVTLSSGVYIYRLQATSLTTGREFTKVRKMILMK